MPITTLICPRCRHQEPAGSMPPDDWTCSVCGARETPLMPDASGPEGRGWSALDHLEQSVRRLEQRTHELEQSLAPDYSTVLDDAVRFSLTNLRSQLHDLEQRTGDTGERLQLLALEYADLQREPLLEEPAPAGTEGGFDALLKPLLLEIESLRAQLAEQQDQRRLAEEEAERLRPLPQHVQDLAGRLAVAQQSLRALEAERARNDSERHSDRQRISDQQARINALQSDVDSSRTELARLRSTEAENRTLREQLDKLRRSTSDLDLQSRGLRVQLREARRTIVDAARMVGTVDELRERLRELGRTYAETLEEADRVRRENLDVRAELKELLRAIESISADPDTASDLAALRDAARAAEQAIVDRHKEKR